MTNKLRHSGHVVHGKLFLSAARKKLVIKASFAMTLRLHSRHYATDAFSF
jgi:hypothetical protein